MGEGAAKPELAGFDGDGELYIEVTASTATPDAALEFAVAELGSTADWVFYERRYMSSDSAGGWVSGGSNPREFFFFTWRGGPAWPDDAGWTPPS